MKRILCLLLLICLAIPVTAFADEHEYIGRMMVVNCRKNVSLRAEPGQSSERLDWVDYHTVLENCWSGYGDYYYVEYYGTPGYIHSQYLEAYEEDEIYWGEYYETMQVVSAPDWTPLREMADVNAKELAKIPNGAILNSCVYYADDYTYVEYNGLEGYVLTEYITIGSENFTEPDLCVKYVTNCNEEVSLREKPTSSSARKDWVPKGMALQAFDARDGYFYVCYAGQYGYVHGDYLANIGYTGDFVGEMRVTNCSQGIGMLAEPAPGFGIKGMIPEGAVVGNCYEAHDGYYYVNYGDLWGYIHGDYLEVCFDHLLMDDMAYLGDMQVFNDYGDDWFFLRAQPDEYSALLGKMPAGTVVSNCRIYNDEYVYAEYDGQGGFLPMEDVTEVHTLMSEEIFESMRVVNCTAYAAMLQDADHAAEMAIKVPLGAVVTDCWPQGDEFFFCNYYEVSGYIDRCFLEPIEGPCSNSDDQLSNSRIDLNYEGAAFGAYLISESMGGEWSVIAEKHHLENVLRGMPEEWRPVTMTIPDERIIEIIGGKELYLIIPADESAEVAVNRLKLGYDGFTGQVEEVLYEGDGEPILVRCSEYQDVMDCEIVITGQNGERVRWYPVREMNGEGATLFAYDGTGLNLAVYEQE